jgi:hypothetical protein
MLNIFAVRDIKSGSYGIPFCHQTIAEAIRDFTRGCNDERLNLNMFPEDFELYFFGGFDQVSGKYHIIDKPEFVINAVTCSRKQLKQEVADVATRINQSSEKTQPK